MKRVAVVILKGCKHWVHVSCQINKNINGRHRCSLCLNEIVNKDHLELKICEYLCVSKLPIHYQFMLHKKGVSVLENNRKDINKYGLHDDWIV